MQAGGSMQAGEGWAFPEKKKVAAMKAETSLLDDSQAVKYVANNTRVAREVENGSSNACSISIDISPDEGTLKDIRIESDSRIQEVYVSSRHSKNESYVGTFRGAKTNPTDQYFTSQLSTSTFSPMRVSTIRIKFLSIKGDSKDVLKIEKFEVEFIGLKLNGLAADGVSTTNMGGENKAKVSSSQPPTGILGVSSEELSSQYDTFSLFSMYKSMLMTEMSQLLDAKLSPISKQLCRLEKKLDDQDHQIRDIRVMMSSNSALLKEKPVIETSCSFNCDNNNETQDATEKGDDSESCEEKIEGVVDLISQTSHACHSKKDSTDEISCEVDDEDDDEAMKSDMSKLLNLMKMSQNGDKDISAAIEKFLPPVHNK